MAPDEASLAASPEHRLGVTVHQVFASLDDLMAMGNDPATRELVQQDTILLGQIESRLQWIGSFISVALAAREVPKLKVVSNNNG